MEKLRKDIKEIVIEATQTGVISHITSEQRETISRIASELANEHFNPFCSPCLFRAANIINDKLIKSKKG